MTGKTAAVLWFTYNPTSGRADCAHDDPQRLAFTGATNSDRCTTASHASYAKESKHRLGCDPHQACDGLRIMNAQPNHRAQIESVFGVPPSPLGLQ
jgi:hypothetical protein